MTHRTLESTKAKSRTPLGRPIRVIIVDVTLKVGGVERIMGNLLESFDRSRVRPSLVLIRAPGPMVEQLKVTDVPIYHSLGKGRLDPRILCALIRIIRKERPDLLYTYNYPLTMFYNCLAGLLTGVRTHVVALHSIGYLTRPGWRRFWLNALTHLITRLVAVSQGQKRYYVETHGTPVSKIEVIYGAVDIEKFTPGPQDSTVRQNFGIPGDARAVGILASLRPEKRHDIFIEAAEKIVRTRQDAYFLIVGDGPERSRLEALADEKKLHPFLQFLGNQSDVPSILRQLDIAVLSSDPVVETLHQCLLEAMATGLPVVSTNVGSIDELVVEGETGFLTPPGDPQSLADKIAFLLDNPDVARELGQAGRRRVEEHFSKETMVRSFEDLFERLVLEREARKG